MRMCTCVQRVKQGVKTSCGYATGREAHLVEHAVAADAGADETLYFAFCFPESYTDTTARLAWIDALFGLPAAAVCPPAAPPPAAAVSAAASWAALAASTDAQPVLSQLGVEGAVEDVNLVNHAVEVAAEVVCGVVAKQQLPVLPVARWRVRCC